MIDLETGGYAVAGIHLASEQSTHIARSLPTGMGGHGGMRSVLGHPTVAQFLRHPTFGLYIWSVVGRELAAVNATLFEKTAEFNRRAGWHQDRLVSVKERMDVRGYGGWSTRLGVVQVEAPAEVLGQMLAVRIHIDESASDSGPFRVIPGSHRRGKLDPEELAALVAESAPVDLLPERGELLLMRPLLVHASAPVAPAQHRRVIHIELAPVEAISPLQWQTVIPLHRPS